VRPAVKRHDHLLRISRVCDSQHLICPECHTVLFKSQNYYAVLEDQDSDGTERFVTACTSQWGATKFFYWFTLLQDHVYMYHSVRLSWLYWTCGVKRSDWQTVR